VCGGLCGGQVWLPGPLQEPGAAGGRPPREPGQAGPGDLRARAVARPDGAGPGPEGVRGRLRLREVRVPGAPRQRQHRGGVPGAGAAREGGPGGPGRVLAGGRAAPGPHNDLAAAGARPGHGHALRLRTRPGHRKLRVFIATLQWSSQWQDGAHGHARL
ncbi:unnamed protein product, partial [Heterosigma akashiwo]